MADYVFTEYRLCHLFFQNYRHTPLALCTSCITHSKTITFKILTSLIPRC